MTEGEGGGVGWGVERGGVVEPLVEESVSGRV